MTASRVTFTALKSAASGGNDITFTRATDGLSGVTDGQLLVAHITLNAGIAGSAPTISAPAGWNAVPGAQVTADGGQMVVMRMFWRIASSEAATYTFSHNGTQENEAFAGRILVYEDHDGITPINVMDSDTAVGGSGSPFHQFTASSIDTSVDDCLILTLLGFADSATTSVDGGAGEVYDEGVDVGLAVTLAAVESEQLTAGTHAAQTFTLTGPGTPAGAGIDSRASIRVAIGPGVTAPEGELTIDATTSLTIDGTGQGFGALAIDAESTLTMDGAGSNVGEGDLSISAIAELTVEGHPLDNPNILILSATSAITMDGAEVGEQTLVLNANRSTFAIEGTAFLEVGSAEDGFVGEEGEVVPPDPSLTVKRIIRTIPSINPLMLDDNGHLDVDLWSSLISLIEDEVWSWGSLRVNIGGRWVSNWRGVPIQVQTWSEVEPFGHEFCQVRFPQITPYEALPDWLSDESNMSIWQADEDGDLLDVLWEGLVASIEDDGQGIIVQGQGALFQLDDYVNRAHLTEHGPLDIGHLIAREVTPNARDRRAFRCVSINKANTGIEQRPRGDWSPILTGYVADLLSVCVQDDGDQWTIHLLPGRKPHMTLKDTTTEHYSIHALEQGVEVKLRLDTVLGTTTIFGEGVGSDNCKWYNAKYPNIRYGDVPVFSGTIIHPGDTHTDYGLFSLELANRGWQGFAETPGNTYDFHEEDDVRAFQQAMGIQVDGIVGPQTWTAAFGVGADTSELEGAFIHSIASKSYTEAYHRDPQGAQTDPNADFDSKRRRIERYVNYGAQISKNEAARSAWDEINRESTPGLFGTIELTMDPPEISRFELKAGRNISLRDYRGSDRLLHIARKEVDWDSGRVSLTVDQKGRDSMTLAQMLTRDRETHNPNRRREVTRRNRSRTASDTKPIWDCENGAGVVPAHAIYAGLWNIVRIPAGKNGTIVRSLFQVENPAQMAVGIFDRPMTAAQMLLGEGENQGNPLFYSDYWDQFGDELLVAWGEPDNPAGWSPFDGPDDDNPNTQITGIHDDRGTWYYETTEPPWLWVAMWVEPSGANPSNVAFIQGRLYASNEAT